MSQNPDTQPRKVRRFLPQLVETCSRKVGGLRPPSDVADLRLLKGKLPRRGNLPAVGFSSDLPPGRSHLKRPRGTESNDSIVQARENESLDQGGTTETDKQRVESGPSGRDPSHESRDRPRRFAPEAIETGKRSFRRGDSESQNCNPSKEFANGATRSSSDSAAELAHQSRFSYSSLVQRQGNPRRHSFRVPDLPTIPNESSEVEPSSTITSATESPVGSPKPPHTISQHRESCYEPQAKYLLSLAAQSAEKQLKEQALAAFPTEQVYQPVDHFAVDTEEDEVAVDEDPVITENDYFRHRRASSADLSWALENMRLHKEDAEMRNRAMIGMSELQGTSPVTAPPTAFHAKKLSLVDGAGGSAPERRATSPPMLGDDLIFPQSLSPVGSFACPSQKHQDEDSGGLWHGNFHGHNNGAGGGLWMGTCKPAENGVSSQGLAETSTSIPDDSEADERRRRLQETNGNEFHDGFVTQIYNYLSLGYPCIARYYDYELSEVSGIPIDELRQDDLNTDAKGYAGISGEPNGTDSTGRQCMRWVALRAYIHEVAKKQHQPQQFKMVEGAPTIETWGVRERKGSWAL